MRKLTLSADNFDQINTFAVFVGSGIPPRCSLRRGYQTKDDGIYWALMHSSCLKAEYTDVDRAERERLASETPLRNQDRVEIDGNVYRVHVLGYYSDCAIFKPVNA